MQTKGILSSRISKQTKPQSCPETSTANSRLVEAKGVFSEKVCAYNERRRVNLKFCLADFVYLIQELRSNCVHLSNEYAKISKPSVRFLNQINKIRETKLFVISTYLLLKNSLRLHQTRFCRTGFRATLRLRLF